MRVTVWRAPTKSGAWVPCFEGDEGGVELEVELEFTFERGEPGVGLPPGCELEREIWPAEYSGGAMRDKGFALTDEEIEHATQRAAEMGP